MRGLLALLFLTLACGQLLAQGPPAVRGKSAILFDVDSGEVLYKKNDTERRPIASTQKLLTALLVARSGDLDKEVVIQPVDTYAEPTKLYLKPGDSYPRRQLLTALLVKSANDSARALARDNAGSIGEFADKMNAAAARLGAKDSHFVNPNGLPTPDQYSTARDLACIARAAYRNEVLHGIMGTINFTFRYASGRSVKLLSTNHVLRGYTFCNGMKTGYTELAGHCLVASGSYGGKNVISIILGSGKAAVWEDSTRLLAYGLGIDAAKFARPGAE